MKLLLVATPLFVFSLFVLVRTIRGRPLSRPNLNGWVALLLLAYSAGTAGVGLFWVAKMALPKFDLHYMLGYCMIVLVAWHVILQFRVLEAFFRRSSPQFLLTEDRRRFRASVRRTTWILAGLAAVSPVAWVIQQELRPAASVSTAPQGATTTPGSSGDKRVELWIERGGERQSAIEYLYEQASSTRSRPLSRALQALRLRRLSGKASPPPCKPYLGSARIALSTPRQRVGVTLHAALGRAVLGIGYASVAEATSAPIPSPIPAPPNGALPDPPRPTIGLSGDASSKVTLEALAQILHYSNGVTTSRSGSPANWHRAAPSAGARYPTDIYIAARRVEGLEPGIYYYHPHEHALVLVAGREALERFPASVSAHEAARDAPVSFLLGVTFERTVSKYDTHGFRYVTIDTGHVAANLQLAAAAMNIRCETEPLFDDEALLRVVGGKREEEGMLLAISCTGTPSLGSIGESRARLIVPEHSVPPPPADPDLVELTRLSHDLTSWQLLPGLPQAKEQLALPLRKSPGTSVRLPPADDTRLDVFEAIGQRRSFRRYAANVVPQRQFAGVLRDAAVLAPTTRGQQLLALYVSVSRVEGLEPGVYEYLPESHAVTLVKRGDKSDALEVASFSQQVLGNAAFVLMWAMRKSLVEQLDGVRGYRHAHLDAGMAGETANLSVVARGLGSCGVGAFDNDRVNALVETESLGNLALFVMGVGSKGP